MTEPTTDPPLPDLVRRWSLDHFVNRRIVLDDVPWQAAEGIPPGQIIEAVPLDNGGGSLSLALWRFVREIPEAEVARYVGAVRDRSASPLPMLHACDCRHPPLRSIDFEAATVPRSSSWVAVQLDRHLFRFEGGRRNGYRIGQCPECRAVYWAEERDG